MLRASARFVLGARRGFNPLRPRIAATVRATSLPRFSFRPFAASTPTEGRRSTFMSSHFRIDEFSVIQYFERKKMIYKIQGNEIVVKYCPLCPKPHGDKLDNLWKLYFERSSGVYFCHRCQARGSWYARVFFADTRALASRNIAQHRVLYSLIQWIGSISRRISVTAR
jgi:hypothetical protein